MQTSRWKRGDKIIEFQVIPPAIQQKFKLKFLGQYYYFTKFDIAILSLSSVFGLLGYNFGMQLKLLIFVKGSILLKC